MIFKFLQLALSSMRQWNQRRATVRTLRALPDWQLRDIGLTRDQIVTAVDAALGAHYAGKTTAAKRPQIRPQTLETPVSGGKAVTT